MESTLREECAERLRASRDEWAKRLGAIQSDRRRQSGEFSADFEDQATQRENDETLDGLDSRGREAIAAIDAALARVEAGSYGACAACGEEIPAARLQAEPAAATCIGCAQGPG